MTKKDFFESVEDQYAHHKDGYYKRIKGRDSIEGAEYLHWDHLHNEVEAYCKGGKHMGALDPATKSFYKAAVYGRELPKHIR